ncbi:Variable major outer membrane lipoprotein [Borrelia duttonii CR2A]|uniref:Variable large protein n=1 Tax=Borrelia duttonii CR2A TaxID=1432657 RepID=W6TK92_9SPIR|nr:Variable major outer membrane lipoprotein [Borrelia duttonii CR2A]
MMEVGRSAENAFYAFLELVSDVLGFNVNTTTKREDVGGYFNNLGKRLGEASKELEEVVKKSEVGVDKSDLSKNPIREIVNSAKGVLDTLKGHLESLGQVGDANLVGEAVTNNKGVTVDDNSIKKALKALQEIVKVAKGENISEPRSGSTAVKLGDADNKEGAKILSTNEASEAGSVSKAVLILSSVSGEEMLASIVKSTENRVVALTGNATSGTTPLEFAKGGTSAHLANASDAKAAAVAGGIALRSLIKDGKLASGAQDGQAGGKEEVQKVGITAVNKLLGAVEDIVKKTVKNVIEKVKQEVDKARDPKAAGQ